MREGMGCRTFPKFWRQTKSKRPKKGKRNRADDIKGWEPVLSRRNGVPHVEKSRPTRAPPKGWEAVGRLRRV